jgi:alkylhydroperoxidase/carboxymuconolactone decarboxylase family protein YurZ
VTQCPYYITGHTPLAHRKGATPEQIMEAIWVAAEMRAGVSAIMKFPRLEGLAIT